MKYLLVIVPVLWLSGCSVGMALSGQKAPDMSVLSIGQTRGVIETQFGQPVSSFNMDDGNTYVTYAYSTGNEPSAGRAVAHGVMDVLTLGLWEVVGTPVEAIAGQDEEHAIVVVYNNQGVVVGVNEPGSLRREDEVAVLKQE